MEVLAVIFITYVTFFLLGDTVTYYRLWLKAFKLLFLKEGLKCACFVMFRGRKERAINELKELIIVLEDK